MTRKRVSNNPFMVTSNQTFGMSLSAQKLEMEATKCNQQRQQKQKNHQQTDQRVENDNNKSHDDLSFLYSRESDRIGEGIEYSDSALAKVLIETKESRSEIALQRRDMIPMISSSDADDQINPATNKAVDETDIADMLAHYKHEPKTQNPLYATTSNAYGIKKPTVATCTGVRIPRGQKFSNSFNRIMFRNEGLNTSVTRSIVHAQLDPGFV